MTISEQYTDGTLADAFARMFTRFWSPIEKRIPFGYEDEIGFHCGQDPFCFFWRDHRKFRRTSTNRRPSAI
jgi:hypothetical protein